PGPRRTDRESGRCHFGAAPAAPFHFTAGRRMRGVESARRPSLASSAVLLLVGGLVGFGAGYFAGGGGRPAPATGGAAAAPSGDRIADLTRTLDRDPENPELLIELGN